MNQFITELSAAYATAANATRAQQQKAYIRHQFNYLGIDTPVRRKIDQSIIKKYSFSDERELIDLVKQLWAREHREYLYCAIELLIKHHVLWTPQLLQEIYQLAQQNAWWDSIDTLASNVVGALLQKYPHLVPMMSIWIGDENLWIRRIAVIFQLRYKKQTNTTMLFEHCLARAHEKDFFIRKAIGWALREYAKTDPEAVRAFVATHQHRLSALSIKEACKHLR